MRKTVRLDDSRVDLTPMLDIVFIMLIFFVVTASFVQEQGLDVAGAKANVTTTDPKEAVVVRIEADNRIYLASNPGRPIDVRRVRANLEQALAASPEAPVVIQAARDADTGTIVTVYDQALLVDKHAKVTLSELD